MDLQHASQHFKLLADSTRLRLLMLVDKEELSVAELAAITQLAQPRVSTHLAKLKEAGLVSDRREGVFVYYRMAGSIADESLKVLWELLRENTDDPLIRQDFDRISPIGRRADESFNQGIALKTFESIMSSDQSSHGVGQKKDRHTHIVLLHPLQHKFQIIQENFKTGNIYLSFHIVPVLILSHGGKTLLFQVEGRSYIVPPMIHAPMHRQKNSPRPVWFPDVYISLNAITTA